MLLEEIIKLLNLTLPRHLTPLQEQVLQLAWDGRTYGEMATLLHYQDAYLKNIASHLWQELSLVFGEPINKINFHLKLKSRVLTPEQQELIKTADRYRSIEIPTESPYGAVPLGSSLYIERPPIEQLAYAEIYKPGGVLRIKAPSKMGKSSLLLRIIAHAEAANYAIVQIDLKEAEEAIFDDLDKFLRWFCVNISRKLNLLPKLGEFWDEDAGSKANCNHYLQDYILPRLENPFVVVLNEIHQVCDYPKIARDFFPLLRFWHEQSRQFINWQKLRLVVVHSTEIYFPLHFDQSPFNVGLPLNLPEFTLQQVQELALRHHFDWTDEEGRQKVRSLMQMVGGHPYLIRLALYYLRWRSMSLDELLENAPTPTGIYGDHLRNYLVVLQAYPELAAAWSTVVEASEPVQLEGVTAYKLESLGLVKREQEMVKPSCDLYRIYFQRELAQKNPTQVLENYLWQLEQDNQRLQDLCQIDDLTQVANRQGFDYMIDREWRRLARQKSPLSLIICDIDRFAQYNNIYGNLIGDLCLKQIAEVVSQCLQRASDFIGRFGTDEFAIILPETDAAGAVRVAQTIRVKIQELAIPFNNEVVTLSLGVACTIPQPQESITRLIHEAAKACQEAKTAGRDRVIVSSVLNYGL